MFTGGTTPMTTVTDDVRGFLPLKSRAFHMLLVLSEGDRHGYAIKQEVEELTAGVLRLGPGTLYESIQRLEKKGLIEESPDRPDEAEDHSQRRYYRLTPIGRRVLAAEVERIGRVIDHARARISPD
jgi:DNA-binding PadR family transcriptional regulator